MSRCSLPRTPQALGRLADYDLFLPAGFFPIFFFVVLPGLKLCERRVAAAIAAKK
jgi:hypothetical protein